jgi:UDP:flavonoid glycosyltransferase YjiC (YdhE family)
VLLNNVQPGWCDCFGYAIKAEYLGVGIYGNRRSVPSFNAPELAAALRRILVTDANAYRRRARELADLAKAGGGVERAADIILRDAGLRA